MGTTSALAALPCPVQDPMLCYSTRGPLERRRVDLQDQFDSGRYEVRHMKRFCAPASINGATIGDVETHLSAYHLRGPHVPRRRFQVTNQFGTFSIDTSRTETLMVPAAKSLAPDAPPGPPDPGSAVDHYRCLRAFPSAGTTRLPETRRLRIVDQFGTRLGLLTHLLKLCVAVDKNGEGIKHPGATLTCYEVTSTPVHTRTGVQTNDQFGPRTIVLRREYELCVPSVVECDDENPCTEDSCTTGTCVHTPVSPGTVCRPASGECDAPDVCVGAECPANSRVPAGTPCTDDGNLCTVDECDGVSVDCQHRPGNAGTVCRASAGECDLPEVCPGNSATCPADARTPAGTVCRPAAGECDLAETCTGQSVTCPADVFKPSTTVCRTVGGECELPASCTGTSATCPTGNGHKPPGTPCTDDGDVCTTDRCDGTSAVCQHAPGNAGTVCRPSAGDCDPSETCTGTTPACPPDVRTPAGTVCRPAAGECDRPETCTGTNATCPADLVAPSGTACTDDGNICTIDQCDGSTIVCRHLPGNAGLVCRPAAGDCDVAESCTGQSPACPPDAFKPSTTVCRNASGECDLSGTCTGTSPTCPSGNGHKPPGTPCEDDGNICTIDRCDGSSSTCQHTPGNAGTPCRASGGVCDLPESCDGTSPSCPHDAKRPAGTVCRDAGGECDPAETCTGTSNSCPDDRLAPPGTPCDGDDDVCTVEECDAKGKCSFVGSSTDPSCGFCGDTAKGPCVVTVGSRTFGKLQDAVNYARDGATITVRGVCWGMTSIDHRNDLVIEGVRPTTAGCPEGGLVPSSLTSTIRGSDDEAIKVTNSTGIVIRFLNVTEADSAGVELKNASTGTVHCNCIARNEEGIELHGGGHHDVSQNLVTRNAEDGIRLRSGTDPAHANDVHDNVVSDNSGDGIDVLDAVDNTVADNDVHGNAEDGIDLSHADQNRILRNLVQENGSVASSDSGIELDDSDRNTIDANTITGNSDGLSGVIRCDSGDANTGSNVTSRCR